MSFNFVKVGKVKQKKEHTMLNQMILEAGVVKNQGLKYSTKGTAYLGLSLVFDTLEKKDNQWNAKKNYILGTIWGKPAERLAQRIKVGSQLIIRGKLEQRSWIDKEGKNKSLHALTIEEVHFSKKSRAKMAYA